MELLASLKAGIILVGFCLLFCAERIFPKDIRLSSRDRIVRNLSFWPLTAILSIAVMMPITYQATHWHLWDRPAFLQSVWFDVLLLDLFLYFWHRALHEQPFLWRFHQVHHHDLMLDTTTAVRFHFGELMLSASIRAVFIMLTAIPFESVVWFEVFVMTAAFFHHSNLKLPVQVESLLSKIVVTPSIHWVHHHAKRVDTDSNYGTILSCWDRLFRSRSSYQRRAKMIIGIEGIRKDLSFFRLLMLPFNKK